MYKENKVLFKNLRTINVFWIKILDYDFGILNILFLFTLNSDFLNKIFKLFYIILVVKQINATNYNNIISKVNTFIKYIKYIF